MNICFKKVALYYFKKYGLSVLPCKGKRPLIDWKRYQHTMVTEEEIDKWGSDYPKADIGLVCGSHSDTVVLEIDNEEAYISLDYDIPDNTPMVVTGSGRPHYHFRYPKKKGLILNNYSEPGQSGEIFSLRVENQIAMIPPSIHPDTKKPYRWKEGLEPWSIQKAELPEDLLELITVKPRNYNTGSNHINTKTFSSKQLDDLFDIISPKWLEGHRQDLTQDIAGYLAKKHYSNEAVVRLITKVAESNGDTELYSDRIPSINITYKKLQEQGVHSIKGWSGRLQTMLSQEEKDRLQDIVSTSNFKSNDNKRVKVTSVSEIKSRVIDKDAMICEPIAVKGQVSIITGKPGVGKSFFTLEAGRCMITNQPFLGKFQTIKGNVVYFNEENSTAIFTKRFNKLGMPDVGTEQFGTIDHQGLKIETLRH